MIRYFVLQVFLVFFLALYQICNFTFWTVITAQCGQHSEHNQFTNKIPYTFRCFIFYLGQKINQISVKSLNQTSEVFMLPALSSKIKVFFFLYMLNVPDQLQRLLCERPEGSSGGRSRSFSKFVPG